MIIIKRTDVRPGIRMITIRVEPGGIEFEAQEGETVMDAALRAGYYWPTTCGGECRCTTCAMVITDGSENVDPMGRSERRALTEGRNEAAATRYRLACQVRVHGDVIVEKSGVRPD